eukprot:3950484-Pleurochrysis_carterae.AAC.1
MPSGRLYGPEKSSRTVRELCAGKRLVGAGVDGRRCDRHRGMTVLWAPWVVGLVEVYVGGGDDTRDTGHPHVVGAGREEAAADVEVETGFIKYSARTQARAAA